VKIIGGSNLRRFKLGKRMILGSNGYHTLYFLLEKQFEAKANGRANGF